MKYLGPITDEKDIVNKGYVDGGLAGKVSTADYAPVAKTADMTQAVGRDANGQLWTEPGADGAWEELLSVTLEEDTSNILYIEETGNFNKRYKQLAIFVSLGGTATIYPTIGFCNESGAIIGGWRHDFYGCQNSNYGAIKSSDSTYHAFLIDVLSAAPSTPVITRKINGAYGTSTYPSSIFGTSTRCIVNETVAGLTYGFAINAATTQSAFPAGSTIQMYGVKRTK